MPAFNNTTWPAGHPAMALLICDALAPGFNVAHMVVRFGTPPATTATDQSAAREALKTPDHGWALTSGGVLRTRPPRASMVVHILLERHPRMRFAIDIDTLGLQLGLIGAAGGSNCQPPATEAIVSPRRLHVARLHAK